ncbi:MAG: hypothetical protein IT371_25415 [Deltaproteobacteria bacterium]|nr:hypothetical protein [Deltaproteobacteria bacterium]
MAPGRHLSTVLALLGLAGCCPPPPGREARAAGGATSPAPRAAQALAALRAVSDGFRTLRTVHRVELEIPLPGGGVERRRFTGVLAVQRPSSLRLRVLGPFSLPLFDLLGKGEAVQIKHLAAILRRRSQLPGILDSIAADLRAAYGLGAAVRPEGPAGDLTSWTDGHGTMDLCRGGTGDVRRCWQIQAATGRLTALREWWPDGTHRRLLFDEHRQVGPLALPLRMRVQVEGKRRYRVAIRVEAVEPDVPLDPELFR